MIPESARKYVYYEEPDIVLLHGDCLEILPLLEAGSVDLVLTDPPYGINFQSNHRAIKYEKIVNDDKLPLEHIKACIDISTRASFIFCRWDNLYDLPKPRSVIAWVKNN